MEQYQTPDFSDWQAMPDWMKEIYDTCPPRWGPTPTPGAPNLLELHCDVAHNLGDPLRNWQMLAVRVGTELREDGMPRFRDFLTTTPRQGGKSYLEFVGLVTDMLMLPTAAHGLFVAQSGSSGVAAIHQKWIPKVANTPLWRLLNVQGSKDKANPYLHSLSRETWVDIHTGSEKAGHGATLYRVRADEVWAFVREVFTGSIRQAIRAVPSAQSFYYSTVGEEDADFLNDMIYQGRIDSKAGLWQRLGVLEWSGDESLDPKDPVGWRQATPFLDDISSRGEGVTMDTIMDDYLADKSPDKTVFRRSALNQIGEATVTTCISTTAYEACTRPVKKVPAPTRPIVWGIDVHPSGGSTCVTAVDAAGWMSVLRIERGRSWVVPFAKEVREDPELPTPDLVVVKGSSQAGLLADELEVLGFKVKRLSASQVSAACASLRNRIHSDDEEVLRIADNFRFTAAVRAAIAPRGDKEFVFVRAAADADLTPLYSGAYALVGADELKSKPVRRPVFRTVGRKG